MSQGDICSCFSIGRVIRAHNIGNIIRKSVFYSNKDTPAVVVSLCITIRARPWLWLAYAVQ
jgi:hypothetical protein